MIDINYSISVPKEEPVQIQIDEQAQLTIVRFFSLDYFFRT